MTMIIFTIKNNIDRSLERVVVVAIGWNDGYDAVGLVP